jgi:FtsP/CotA-like multicopper oxidase with cupredoxin domain
LARLTRRRILCTVPAAEVAVTLPQAVAGEHHHAPAEHDGRARLRGTVDHAASGFDPQTVPRDFERGTTSRLADGRTLRELEIVAIDREVEVALGIKSAAWTSNGRLPGPTRRAGDGERVGVTLHSASDHPHAIHWHGTHPATQDRALGTVTA